MANIEQAMNGAMNEAVDAIASTVIMSGIVGNIGLFGGVIKFVNDFLDSTIAAGNRGSLRGSGASAFKGSWDEILSFSKEYESTLMTWVENIQSQIAEMQKTDSNIAEDMAQVNSELDSSHQKIEGALNKVANDVQE